MTNRNFLVALVVAGFTTQALAFGYDPKWPSSISLQPQQAATTSTQRPLMLVSPKDLLGYEAGARLYGYDLQVFRLPDLDGWSLLAIDVPTPPRQARVTVVAFGGGLGGRPGDGGHTGSPPGPNGGVGGTGLDLSHMATDFGLAISSNGAYTHAPADEANPFGNATPAGLGGNGGNYSSDSNGGTAVGGNDACGCTSGEPF